MGQQNPPSYYRTPRRSRWDSLHNAVWWVLRAVNLMLLLVLAGGVGVAVGSYTGMARVIPNVRDLGDVRPGAGSRILSADGELLATLSIENRQFVSIDRIPKAAQQAAVAIEDRDFYRHVGVDPRGIMRALYQDFRHRGVRQGGSTITQQLAGGLYLDRRERTLSRKLAEAVLAVQLERAYTKPEIMELYLNQIYFGEGAYGIQVAAKTYFGKNVWDLDLSEAAMLAGLARAPERYSPFKDEELATARRNLVLEAMAEEGFIDAAQQAEAKAEPLHLSPERKPLARGRYRAPYFVDYVIKEFADQYGADALYRGNYTLHTTLNTQMQDAAEEAVRTGAVRAEHYRMDQMALVALDVNTGAVKAMVGGKSYAESQYNRTAQGGRPAGSSFKPFVYTAALLQGYTPDSIVTGERISYPSGSGGRWTPGEYGGGGFGRMTARMALAKSSNRAAVNLAAAIGIRSVIETAAKMGIPRENMEPVLPLAIGYCDVTPLEMASAFSIFATRGLRTEPYSIQRIVDGRGRTVDEHKAVTWRVLERDVADDMVSMLTDVVQRGTAARIRNTVKDFPAAGKTGTSSSFKDAWFVGFTPDLAAAVWTGTDQFTAGGGGAAGGTLSAPVWADFMVKAEPIMQAARAAEPPEPVEVVKPQEPRRERPEQAQPRPPTEPLPSDDMQEPALPPGQPDQQDNSPPPTTIVTKRVCPESGMLAGPYCPDPREISYDTATGNYPPDQVCTIHRKPAAERPKPPGRQGNTETPRRVTLDICYITGKLATPYCPIVVKRTFDIDDAPTENCTRHGRR
jgi:1A family penicillin-binding protein